MHRWVWFDGYNKAKREYLLTGLIECADCGATYVGHCSTNTKGCSTRYYVCGNKYRTRTCKAKNINADDIEMFVVMQLKEYFRTTNFDDVAEQIAKAVNSASADLTKEKRELVDVNKIHRCPSTRFSLYRNADYEIQTSYLSSHPA